MAPPSRGPGRPADDRPQIARTFVAKAVLNIPTTSALIERLHVDRSLRRICGWERRSDVPGEWTFSRAFAEFAAQNLPERVHEHLVRDGLHGHILGHLARDATEIDAREKPKAHPFQGLSGPGRDGAKVKKFHNFATDDAPSTPHWCTSIMPPHVLSTRSCI